jgi:hypothetical protein
MKSQKTEEARINVHDDVLMTETLAIRPPHLKGRDKSLWTKTEFERNALDKAKHRVKKYDMHFHTKPYEIIPVVAKLVVYLRKSNRGKSTFSFECKQSSVKNILLKFGKTLLKYSYNGKTYQPDELPFWK